MRALKTRLDGDDVLIGCWINLFDPIASEIIGAAGYDLAMIDLEHGPGSVMEALAVMQAVAVTSKTTPIPRKARALALTRWVRCSRKIPIP